MDKDPTVLECSNILEVRPDANVDQVRRAYQRLVQIWHPDRFLLNTDIHAEAEERIKLINKAYAFLLAEKQRQVPGDAPTRDPKAASGGTRASGRKAAFGSGLSPSGEVRLGARGANSFRLLLLVVVCLFSLVAFWSVKGPQPPVLVNASSQTNPPDQSSSAASVDGQSSDPISKLQTTVIIIDQPCFVIFSPSQKELDESSGMTRITIEQFLENARSVKKKLHDLRPDVNVVSTDADGIRRADRTILRSQTCGYGYIFFPALQRPYVLEGLQPIEDIIKSVNEIFHRDEIGATHGPTNLSSSGVH